MSWQPFKRFINFRLKSGILSERYLPQCVLKVVAWLLSSSNWIFQNPFLATKPVKTRAFDSRGRTSSIVSRRQLFLWRALFSGLGSIYSLAFPFAFVVTTSADIHFVGVVPRWIIPIFDSRSNSCLRGSFSAIGTLLVGSWTAAHVCPSPDGVALQLLLLRTTSLWNEKGSPSL